MHGPIMHCSRNVRPITGVGRTRSVQSLLASNRLTILLLLTFAVALPESVHFLVQDRGRLFEVDRGPIEISLVIAIAALVVCHISLRHLSHLPLVSAKLLILPTFIATYSVFIVVFYAMRISLAPYHFWTSALAGILCYSLLGIARSRYFHPILGLIGMPAHYDPNDISTKVQWLLLDHPHLPQSVSAIVVDPHAELNLEWSKFLTNAVLQGIPVYHLSHLEEGLTGRVRFRHYAENDFGALLPSHGYLRLKRVIDLALVVMLAPLVGMILALAMLAVRVDSAGPVIYKQTRRGYRGESFICYKLRTMRCDHSGPAYTLSDDDRITRVGRLLRKWRIDELPQVLNIIRGEMSWIGPRPEAAELALMYSVEVPFYDYRHAVRPGISGWAAVHQGNVALVEAATRKLEYDFYYIKHFSIWLDFLIGLKTVQTIFSGFGSR